MRNKANIWVYVVAITILVPIIFFPASSDLSVFIMGGKIIANGGELYKDYFELKAPLTYYFFALIDFVTNGNIILIRIVDFILFVAFLISSNFILRKLDFNKTITNLYILLVSVSYVTLSYSNTLQCETITFLPSIWYFYFVVNRGKYSIFAKGILLGIIISFKYTLGIIYFAEFFFISAFFGSKSKFIKSKVAEIIIAIGVLICTFLPTISNGNIDYFYSVIDYINHYKSYPPLNAEFFKSFIKVMGSLFGDYYSLTLSSAALVSLFFISKAKEKHNENIYNLLITFFLLLLFSFFIERKPTLYQFARTYVYLALLSSIGIYYSIKNLNFQNKYILSFVIIIALVLSPLPRLFNSLRLPISYFTQGEKYLLNFSNEGGTGNFRTLLNLKEYVDENGDKFIFMSTGSHQFLRMVGAEYKYPQSAFYLAEYDNKEIVEEVAKDIRNMDYIIAQNDDGHLISFFNFLSSYENLKKKEILWNEIQTNFVRDTIIDNRYIVFKKSNLQAAKIN